MNNPYFPLAIGALLICFCNNGNTESLQDTVVGVFGSLGGPVSAISEGALTPSIVFSSTSPSIQYEFDAELGVPKKVPGTLGPAFSASASTLGRGRLALSIAYLQEQFDELNSGAEISITWGTRATFGDQIG